MFRWLRIAWVAYRLGSWEYGTCCGNVARRNRFSGRVEVLITGSTSDKYPFDEWIRLHSAYWGNFKALKA